MHRPSTESTKRPSVGQMVATEATSSRPLTYIGEYAPANACSIRDKVPLTWENGGC